MFTPLTFCWCLAWPQASRLRVHTIDINDCEVAETALFYYGVLATGHACQVALSDLGTPGKMHGGTHVLEHECPASLPECMARRFLVTGHAGSIFNNVDHWLFLESFDSIVVSCMNWKYWRLRNWFAQDRDYRAHSVFLEDSVTIIDLRNTYNVSKRFWMTVQSNLFNPPPLVPRLFLAD